MGLVLQGILVVAVVVALSLVGLWLVHRRIPPARRRGHNDVAGYVYDVIAVVYGVTLAFVLVAAWERFDETRQIVAQEANDLMDLYGAVGALAEPTRDEVRERIRAYARATLEHEWKTIGIGHTSPAAEAEIRGVLHALQEAEPQGFVQQAWYGEALKRLDDLSDSRRMRLLGSRNRLPTAMWVMLIAGAVLTIGFSFLFGVSDVRAHTVMVAVLAGLIALVIYLITALERPFEGVIRLETEGFEQIVGQSDGST